MDLYVAGYFPERLNLWDLHGDTRIMQNSFEFADNGGHKVLWHNLGPDANGVPRFEDVTARTGADNTSWTLALAAADFDGDGWPDLYLANDYGAEELLHNVGGQHFEQAGGRPVRGQQERHVRRARRHAQSRRAGRLRHQHLQVRLPLQGQQSAPEPAGRVGQVRQRRRRRRRGLRLGLGRAVRRPEQRRLAGPLRVNGFISASRDKDYWYDMSKVAGASGDVFEDTRNWAPIGDQSLSGYERSRVLLAQQGRRFTDVAAAVGADDDKDGRGVALADLWNTGALDVVIANQKGPLLVYRNEVDPARDWVGFALTGTASNRSAIGAQVTLEWSVGGQELKQTQLVDGGSGFCRPERPAPALRPRRRRDAAPRDDPVAVGHAAGAGRAGTAAGARGDGARQVSATGTPAATTAGSSVAGPRGAWRIPPIKAPYVFSTLITLILVVGQWKFGIVGGWDRLASRSGRPSPPSCCSGACCAASGPTCCRPTSPATRW